MNCFINTPDKKVLFLLKKNLNSGGHFYNGVGMMNSVKFLLRALKQHKFIKEGHAEVCFDGNSVDRFLAIHKPDVCFIEAFWVTPKKLHELQKKYKKIKFIIRVHSNIPFLAHEGVAIEWMKEYNEIPNVTVAFNNINTARYFEDIVCSIYLPNVYEAIFHEARPVRGHINLASFGAIRPLKNQLTQAIAAIRFGNKTNQSINFHINVNRVEQGAEGVLKNIRSLFKDSRHRLVEHQWMTHCDFLEVVRKMDVGLQVSFSESFNIVSADFVYSGVPVIVSEDIEWAHQTAKVSTTDADAIASKIQRVLRRKSYYLKKTQKSLKRYMENALMIWEEFLHII